ncbi:flavin reductase family protein [Flavobacteriaceae bacterium]|mgnify:FL=1|jgi:flavin reductase (DIM6/NTAB) family NADH-FMN oxidoreductase RutF|nr:flavin reductase family protein [Flavobacteriaceae bacterium]MDB4404560.1 flavin reductase family protein [bacterium]
MIHYSESDLDSMDYVRRINLINSCSGYKSANLIGTVSDDGIDNLAIFSSIIHIGSNPALLGFFTRPTSVIRNTYSNIKSTKYFTINHVHESILADAHHTSAKYKPEISEFDFTNLEPEYKPQHAAPFVVNSPLQLSMEFVEEYDIVANNTILVISKINDLYVDGKMIEKDGFINLSRGKIATINGLDGYSIPKLKTRFNYQRPKPLSIKNDI